MTLVLLVLLLLCPASANATAGFAETHSELLYSDVAFVHWIHPGDGCDCGSYCFQLMKQAPRGAGFPGLHRSLGKINAPAETTLPLVIAQTCSDQHWIVYDLTAEQTLADTESYEAALAVWRSQGLAEPSFADAQAGARGLHQTWRSLAEGAGFLLLMFLPLLVLLSFPLCALASVALFARYRRTRRTRDRVGAFAVLVPTLPGWWLAWLVCSHATRSHGDADQRQAARESSMSVLENDMGATPESSADASTSPLMAPPEAEAPEPALSAGFRSFGIEESTESRAIVDFERAGLDPGTESFETLQLLDGQGVRLARRIAVRDKCMELSDDPEEPDACHRIGAYAYSGPALERFALAFETSVRISPEPLDRTSLPREAQLEQLARVFANGFAHVDGQYAAGWRRDASGDWSEQSFWSDLSLGGTAPSLEPTGVRFSECSLQAFGALTEIDCPKRRTLYLDAQYLGSSDELDLGPAVRYAAQLDGVRVYVVIRALNNVTNPVIVSRSGNEWSLLEVLVSRDGC